MKSTAKKLVVGPGGLPGVNIVNGLHWRTDARGSFDRQRLSGALANPFVTSSSRPSKRD